MGITFGLDAHEPRLVGEAFDRALALVTAARFTHFRRYAGRRFELAPLP